MRNMHNGEWVQVFDLVPNKTISVKRYEKMKAVVDAAREWINCPCEDIRECLECTAFKFSSALAELDEEGER